MPPREIPLVTDEIYHVFNRGITQQLTFKDSRDHDRAIATVSYYRLLKPPLRYSYFMRLPKLRRDEIMTPLLQKAKSYVDLLAYCFMPNHFHFLFKQLINGGISTFMRLFTNSYTRYFNTKRRRYGSLFQGRFKAVLIESEEQLTHVSRYIHLNPYSSGLIKSKFDLESYPYSSFRNYIGLSQNQTCNNQIILELFSSKEDYKEFTFNQADYQRELQFIKHLILEEP